MTVEQMNRDIAKISYNIAHRLIDEAITMIKTKEK